MTCASMIIVHYKYCTIACVTRRCAMPIYHLIHTQSYGDAIQQHAVGHGGSALSYEGGSPIFLMYNSIYHTGTTIAIEYARRTAV